VLTKFTVAVASLALLAACSSNTQMGDSSGGANIGAATHWHTKVYRSEGGKAAGQKSIAHTSVTRLSADRFRASITLPGLLPKGTYAWGIYQGSCGPDGQIVGSESDYPMIEPDANSRGSFTANVNGSLEAGGDYYVTIYKTGGERNEAVGCDKLRVGTEEDSND